jgi:hypothetical protein
MQRGRERLRHTLYCSQGTRITVEGSNPGLNKARHEVSVNFTTD